MNALEKLIELKVIQELDGDYDGDAIFEQFMIHYGVKDKKIYYTEFGICINDTGNIKYYHIDGEYIKKIYCMKTVQEGEIIDKVVIILNDDIELDFAGYIGSDNNPHQSNFNLYIMVNSSFEDLIDNLKSNPFYIY